MQHTETITSYVTGGRRSSPELRASIEMAEAFEGLPAEVERYDLLTLVKRAGRQAGFTSGMIELLDYYMAFTREADWEEGARPIVFQSLAKTALDFGVSERNIQKTEKALFRAGAITWNDSGNHRRYGQRDPKSGRIAYAAGVPESHSGAETEREGGPRYGLADRQKTDLRLPREDPGADRGRGSGQCRRPC